MTRKKGLGRGLDALIAQNITDINSDSISEISLSKIVRREGQPRIDFDDEKIEELAQSIKEHGLISPIVVRKKDDKYEIIAGERRFLASKKAGLEKIAAIVKDMDDREIAEVSLIENIQREDLNSYEEALAYKKLMEEYELTQKDLSEKLSKSRSYIANTLRLLKLDERSLKELREGNITSSQARTLLSVDESERDKYLDKFLNKEINIRKLEDQGKNKKDSKKPKRDPFVVDIENQLLEKFSTKVSIKSGRKGGKIEIEYMNSEDLERILEMIL
ncbi:MAG: ParB/RepB/Spo0J family partition protein [Finegoldia sp.]|nr:ParB/RepB/Spo0J family partition protein [Finegoldia sp.]